MTCRSARRVRLPPLVKCICLGILISLAAIDLPAAAAAVGREEAAVAAAMEVIVRASRPAAAARPEQNPFRGELAQTHPARFGALPPADSVILIDPAQAVARVPAHDRWPDLYFYLDRQNDGAWRATAVRSLALPPFIRRIRDGLRRQRVRGRDEADMLANVELIARPDRELRVWFAQNRDWLEGVRTLAELAAGSGAGPGERSLSQTPVATELRALPLSSATITGSNILRIVIGGVQDDSVGLMHVPAGAGAPPSPSRDDQIWIEPLGDGWFLYRTT